MNVIIVKEELLIKAQIDVCKVYKNKFVLLYCSILVFYNFYIYLFTLVYLIQ